MLWGIGLVIGSLLFYLLPFLPGIIEYHKKTDALSLGVNIDPTVMDYRLRLFKSFIWRYFSAKIIQLGKGGHKILDGILPNGLRYQILSDRGPLLHLSPADVQVFTQDVILPDKTSCKRLYGYHNLETGKECLFFSVYAEHNLVLQAYTKIQNIAYSGKDLKVAEHCQSSGFVKAHHQIFFKSPMTFQCVMAPILSFGDKMPIQDDSTVIPEIPFRQIQKKDIDDHYVFSSDKVYQNHFVMAKNVTIPDRCTIIGNIKCYGNVKMGNQVKIFGAIFCEKNIEMAEDCFILGPMVAQHILFGNQTRVGTSLYPTTVAARHIHIRENAIVFGVILARLKGLFE